MNKIIAAIILMVLSMSAFASGNSYCNSHHNKKALNSCYKQAIQAQNDMMVNNVKVIRSAKNIGQEQKNDFIQAQHHWEVQINNACADNLVCTYDSQVSRNAYLAAERKRLGV